VVWKTGSPGSNQNQPSARRQVPSAFSTSFGGRRSRLRLDRQQCLPAPLPAGVSTSTPAGKAPAAEVLLTSQGSPVWRDQKRDQRRQASGNKGCRHVPVNAPLPQQF
jgi:hypothetical protein